MIQFAVWMPNSPIECSESDSFSITDTLPGGTTITAVTVKLYLGTTDKSATLLTGSVSFSGNVYTTKVLGSMKQGVYVLAAAVTIDGVTTTRKCEVRVQKDSDLL